MKKLRRKTYRHGVFCLEGNWTNDLRQTDSVEPVLRLLWESNQPRIRHIHRTAGTVEELRYYLHKWTLVTYSRYPILYLGFHGKSGGIYIGKRGNSVALNDLREWLIEAPRNRVILFASCSTLNVDDNRLQRFLCSTGVVGIMGYRNVVDWIEATLFEALLLKHLQKFSLTRPGLLAAEKRIRKSLGGSELYEKLGFQIAVRH